MPVERSTAPQQWYEIANTVITGQTESLARQIMARHFERVPDLAERYTDQQRAFYLEDTQHNLRALCAAMLLETPQLFGDYVAWLVNLLEARNIGTTGLPMHFDCTREILQETLPQDIHPKLQEYLETGMKQLSSRP